MEVAVAETAITFAALNTHTSITPAVFSVTLNEQKIDNGAQNTFGLTVNEVDVKATDSFVTTWNYPGTTLELSFSERQTAFYFTGEGSTEITVPPEHTHITFDGIETAVNIPGYTTTLTIMGSSNVIVNIPATSAQMTIPSVEYAFTAILMTAAGGDTSVLGTTFDVTLPSDASALYLYGNGLTTSFALEGITTTFVPEQTISLILSGQTVLKGDDIFQRPSVKAKLKQEAAI